MEVSTGGCKLRIGWVERIDGRSYGNSACEYLFPKSERFFYDGNGNIIGQTNPLGFTTLYGYEYNANGWLTAIKDGGTTTIVGYEYDNAGRRKKRTLENSTVTEYGYDAADQMTNIVHKKTDQTPISSFAYGYDDAGQRVWVKRGNGKGDVYKYDATDQLTNVLYEATNPDTTPSAWTNEARYVFDAAGNRTSVTVTNSLTNSYTANALNQYTQVGSAYPGYDDNGNLSQDGSVWSYFYDRENRLIEAEKHAGGTSIFYWYDAFNRLIQSTQGSEVTRFYYDDQWRLIAEYDAIGNLLAKYVYGPGIDEPVGMTRSGNDYYYHAAALGTVTEITDPSGDLVERYIYDVYGEPEMWDGSGTPIANSQIGNRLLFQGRDRDPDTGLYNFRNRYYSPDLGRFVQVDPIREMGGMNLYEFANNSPAALSDRHGFISEPDGCEDLLRRIQDLTAQINTARALGDSATVAALEADRDILEAEYAAKCGGGGQPQPCPIPIKIPNLPPNPYQNNRGGFCERHPYICGGAIAVGIIGATAFAIATFGTGPVIATGAAAIVIGTTTTSY